MNNKKKIVLSLSVMLFTTVIGCNLSANEVEDFKFEARLVTEQGNENYRIAGLEIIFANYSEKVAKKFEISFQLYDEDGIPFAHGVYEVVGDTGPNKYGHMFLNLDQYFDKKDPKKSFVDYIFINKIVYEDGSEYSDPYGLKFFMKRSEIE